MFLEQNAYIQDTKFGFTDRNILKWLNVAVKTKEIKTHVLPNLYKCFSRGV